MLCSFVSCCVYLNCVVVKSVVLCCDVPAGPERRARPEPAEVAASVAVRPMPLRDGWQIKLNTFSIIVINKKVNNRENIYGNAMFNAEKPKGSELGVLCNDLTEEQGWVDEENRLCIEAICDMGVMKSS